MPATAPTERLQLLKDGAIHEVPVAGALAALRVWASSGAQAGRLVSGDGRALGRPFGSWVDPVAPAPCPAPATVRPAPPEAPKTSPSVRMRAGPTGPGAAPVKRRETAPPRALAVPTDGERRWDGGTPVASVLFRPWKGIAPRDVEVLRMRLSEPGEAHTLEDVAVRHGITREAVRLIVNRTLARVERQVPVRRAIAARVAALSDGGPVPVERLMLEPWTEGLSVHAACLLVERYCGLIGRHAGDLGLVLLPVTQRQWKDIEAAMRVQAARIGPDEPVEAVWEAAIAGHGLEGPDRETVLRALAGAHPGRDVLGLKLRLCRVAEFVDALLPPEAGVRHADELRARQHRSSPDRLSDVQLRNMLVEFAVHVGGYRYTSPRAPAASGGLPEAMVDECLAVMGTGVPGRRWRLDELVTALARRAPGRAPERLAIQRALSTSPRLLGAGPGCWIRAEDAHLAHANREAAAVAILERAGGPLQFRTLLARVEETYGVAKFAQLHQLPRLVVVGPGLWGLADRDIAIGPTLDRAIHEAATRLMAEGPTRIEDVMEAARPHAPKGPMPGHDMALAALRARHGIRRVSDGTLRPTSEGPLRRPDSISACIVEAIGRAGPGGATVEEIREAMLAARRASGLPITFAQDRIVQKVLGEQARPHPDAPGRWILRPWQEGVPQAPVATLVPKARDTCRHRRRKPALALPVARTGRRPASSMPGANASSTPAL